MEHLTVKIKPIAKLKNQVYWRDYRITVLGSRLFRVEKNKDSFCDEATLSVWYRNMPKQKFTAKLEEDEATIQTEECKLIIKKAFKDCRIFMGGKEFPLKNVENLKGTCRTLDNYDGKTHVYEWEGKIAVPYGDSIVLEDGVCARSGVAVLTDDKNLILTEKGIPMNRKSVGIDRYVFAYGDNYLSAVKALYSLTGACPMIPRFALGNWWSRYHPYNEREYLALMDKFIERDVPITVSVIDMDWHYSVDVDQRFGITEQGFNQEKYGYKEGENLGWTGYTWNEELFPDYKRFLKELQSRNLKVSLNLHPAQGVRFWEKDYEKMCEAIGKEATTKEQIEFDITDEKFVKAYFEVLHNPYEEEGVDFWWIDWQQGQSCQIENLDPLWLLNHYHYLDNAKRNANPLILSRYAGIGSHRYPLGFSGDTFMTWKTLKYLPAFTATASNIGYSWWSHDIGGHQKGVKDDELYVRSVQYGVFSPINRLHCMDAEFVHKEPWFYGCKGYAVEEWLRFRHKLIPYLYTASYENYKKGVPLIKPLYYQWKTEKAYEYEDEYLFGENLLVAPITSKTDRSGYAKRKVWLPKGRWTDIFTGDEYILESDQEFFVYRKLEQIPVFAQAGTVLPLSRDKGNGCENPKELEIQVFNGNCQYELYEDGKAGKYFTCFETENVIKEDGKRYQCLKISGKGNKKVLPKARNLTIKFKNITQGEIFVWVDGERSEVKLAYDDCLAMSIEYIARRSYYIEVVYTEKTLLEKVKEKAIRVLAEIESTFENKEESYQKLKNVSNLEEYKTLVNTVKFSKQICEYLQETIH